MNSPDDVFAGPQSSRVSSPDVSGALAALAAFARLTAAATSDIDAVMRALVAHDGWFVPALHADQAWGHSVFDEMIDFDAAPPQSVLTVFTDRDAARLAADRSLGPYVGPVSGALLMRSLTGHCEAVLVNPASPTEHQWYIAASGFDIARTWSTAVGVERALAARGAGPVPAAQLLDHTYQLLLEELSQAPVRVFLPDHDGSFAVCFTAADRADEFTLGLPMEIRPARALATVDGLALFGRLGDGEASGLVINAGSDDQVILGRDEVASIADQCRVR